MRTKMNKKVLKIILIISVIMLMIAGFIGSCSVLLRPYMKDKIASPDEYMLRVNENQTAVQIIYNGRRGQYAHTERYDVDMTRAYVIVKCDSLDFFRPMNGYDIVFVDENAGLDVGDIVCYDASTHELIDESSVWIAPATLTKVCFMYILICVFAVIGGILVFIEEITGLDLIPSHVYFFS